MIVMLKQMYPGLKLYIMHVGDAPMYKTHMNNLAKH